VATCVGRSCPSELPFAWADAADARGRQVDAHLAWDIARAGGRVGFGLLTASVCLGLVLPMRLTSLTWPRFVTNDLHQYLAVLRTSFLVIHVAGIVVDPSAHISVLQSVVPFTASWRPLPLSLGIVVVELLMTVWASSPVRARIGCRWWRRFHALTVAIFVGALLHRAYSGTDTHRPWVATLSAVAAASVGGVLAWRSALIRTRGSSAAIAAGAARVGLDAEHSRSRTLNA
jgi:sulfoxide reductase heme-binding subunit YedZ